MIIGQTLQQEVLAISKEMNKGIQELTDQIRAGISFLDEKMMAMDNKKSFTS